MRKPLLRQTSTIRSCNYSMQMPIMQLQSLAMRDIDLCESRESCQLAPSDNKEEALLDHCGFAYIPRERSENTVNRDEPNYIFSDILNHLPTQH